MCTTALFMGCSAPDIEQQVDELFNKMTQEERIAQLRSMSVSYTHLTLPTKA